MNSVQRHPLMASILGSSISFILYFLLIGQPIWGTNDDPAIIGIASGFWNTPSPNIIYSFNIFGNILTQLYGLNAQFPWYPFLFLILIYFSNIALSYSLIKITKSIFYQIAIVTCILSISFSLLSYLQFTLVAAYSTLAGLSLFIYTVIFNDNSYLNFRYFILNSAAFSLILCGEIIRYKSAILVATFLAPIFIYMLIEKHKRKRQFIQIITMLVVILASSFFLFIYDKREKSQDKEQIAWNKMNNIKSEFLDFDRVVYNQQTKPVFEQVGWDSIDFLMIKNWLYLDQYKFSPEKFIEFDSKYQELGLYDWGFRPNKSIFNFLLYLPNSINSEVNSLFIMLFLVIVLSILTLRRKQSMLYIALLVLTTFGVFTYLFYVQNRVPFRVTYILLMLIMWSLLIIGYKFKHIDIVFSKTYLIIFILLFSLDVYFTRKKNNLAKIQNQVTTNELKTLNQNLPISSLVFNVQYLNNLFPLQGLLNYKLNCTTLPTGWFNQSQIQLEILNDFGINGSFLQEIMQKENIYIAYKSSDKIKDLENLKLLKIYYQLNYGKELNFLRNDSLPGILKLKFTALNKIP